MAVTKAKLPQSTIDGVLGVLALRAGSGKEAPSDTKGTESTRVPDASVSGSSKKSKKRKKSNLRLKKTNVHLGLLGRMVVLGLLSTHGANMNSSNVIST